MQPDLKSVPQYITHVKLRLCIMWLFISFFFWLRKLYYFYVLAVFTDMEF